MKITITLQNIGLWPITFKTLTSTLFDYSVYDETGKEILNHGRLIPHYSIEMHYTLGPTQTKTGTVTWEQDEYTEKDFRQVPKGTYTIVAFVSIIYMNNLPFVIKAQPIMVEVGSQELNGSDSYASATLFKDFVPDYTITNPTFYFGFYDKGCMDAHAIGSSTSPSVSFALWHGETELF